MQSVLIKIFLRCAAVLVWDSVLTNVRFLEEPAFSCGHPILCSPNHCTYCKYSDRGARVLTPPPITDCVTLNRGLRVSHPPAWENSLIQRRKVIVPASLGTAADSRLGPGLLGTAFLWRDLSTDPSAAPLRALATHPILSTCLGQRGPPQPRGRPPGASRPGNRLLFRRGA